MKHFRTTSLNRRQLLAYTGVGALLGAAWGSSFLEAEFASDNPTLTLYRTPRLFSMLIEFESSRLLMLHGDDASELSDATDSTAGFLRHRLDMLLGSEAILQALPASYTERWRISAVFALPDRPMQFISSLQGRRIAIGDLSISCDSVPTGMWNTTMEPPAQPWYIDVSYGSTRCVYGSSWNVFERIAPHPEREPAMWITNDQDSALVTATHGSIIAAPVEAFEALNRSGNEHVGARIVRLYRRYPVSIELRPRSIVVPDDFEML